MNRIMILWFFLAAITTGIAYSQNITNTSVNNMQRYYDNKDIVYTVSDLNPSLVNSTVMIECYINDLIEKNGNVFFAVTDKDNNNRMSAVMFKKTCEDKPERKKLLQQAQKEKFPVYIEGKIDTYKGDLEIKAWKVQEK